LISYIASIGTLRNIIERLKSLYIESFQVIGKTTVKNHLFAAICGYAELQWLKAVDIISNCYKLRRELFNEIISSTIIINFIL
jgi:hypothetical protein